MMYQDYLANGIAIFPLWGIRGDGKCECENEQCESAGKHPRSSMWQTTPLFSDEQVEFMEETGQLDTGYGALVSNGLLIIDVDARNGGVASFERLTTQCPSLANAGLVVETGSGGGSRHYYFRLEGPPVAMCQSVDAYPGIDFKSSGYVVGPGSLHASGKTYEIIYGDASQIGPPPVDLVALLKKPDFYRAEIDGKITDVSDDEIKSMLSVIDPDCGYDKWIKIGMAIHNATDGKGQDLWDLWSSAGDKYQGPRNLDSHWNSFGKSNNPVTLGTLYHYATADGWSWPVTFVADYVEHEKTEDDTNEINIDGIDILRPPGFVGELVRWINSRSRFPREHLAVASALTVISAIAGMRCHDIHDNMQVNVFMFGVAASGSGKESILNSTQKLMASAGVAGAIHGGIKSEQEIFRNLIQHQAAVYLIDEMGELLSKLATARKTGTTPYMQGVIGQLMSIYSKADSYVPVTGDLKREMEKELHSARKSLVAEHGKDPTDIGARQTLERISRNLDAVSLGIPEPYLLLFGLTTPGVFDETMTFDMAVNGFFGRSIIFREMNDNPKRKPRTEGGGKVPDSIAETLRALYSPGYSSTPKSVSRHGERSPVETTPDAAEMLDIIQQLFWDQAEVHSQATDLTPIPRRGYELTAKVSLLLAIPSGVRTVEHVRWAYALIKRDIDNKVKFAHANSAPDQNEALQARILAVIDPDEGETLGKIRNRCRKWKKDIVDKALQHMVVMDYLVEREVSASRGGGRVTKRYFLV